MEKSINELIPFVPSANSTILAQIARQQKDDLLE